MEMWWGPERIKAFQDWNGSADGVSNKGTASMNGKGSGSTELARLTALCPSRAMTLPRRL
ncbi:hypothetical protein CXU10_05475 [Akkermansia muciniphila]|nr:hypothetical protein CXU10_05475 [Akkermansia muciniphila]